ncbi:MAG: hypothetical protein O2938_10025 [Proteobacteria bacterium]|jgi:hypothetical protein|nr:hypothetical protein [Alphaproteobacteria bacterium]MDA0308249.1 hypothetical protein [Pseudomonadota bacterium]MDA0909827.1 hypothetical protein [Pseudomonadota bacterium]MDA1320007.1 hypothetical protein [Pseudomonadota bacterium]NBR38957.1 hypothetical protein [Alphaproteobacteria bacterium]
MSMRPKDIQDSIKIALDAADAATDVTAEYGKIKRENQALEGSVKKIHRSTTIIFFSAIIGVVVTSIFAGLIYFRTMSDLNAITSTSREALIVFAENVNEVNTTLTSLQSALKTQQSLVTQNNQLISELQNLNGNIELTRDAIVTKMQETTDKVSASNKALTDAVSKGLANEITGQNKRVMTQLNTIEANTMEAINNMATGMDDGRQLNAIYTRQGELLELLNKMMSQNMIIMQQIETNKNSITFP